MLKNRFLRLLGLWLCLFSTSAQSALIGILPTPQTVDLGSQAQADLVVFGLGSGAAPSLSTYDIDIGFDPTILALTNVAFGSGLDVIGFGTLQVATSAGGSVNLFELSFDSPSDLDLLQADTFKLATLTFDLLDIGTSGLTIAVNAFGDSLGDPLPVTAQGGSVIVRSGTIAEPSALLLVCLGLAMMFGAAQRRRVDLWR